MVTFLLIVPSLRHYGERFLCTAPYIGDRARFPSDMSYLTRTSAPLRTAGTAFSFRSIAAIHTSSARLALSEDHAHTEDRAADIERHKSDSVEKAKTGRGEWKPELASQSEQATRGDKHNLTMEQMQKMAKEKGQQEGKEK
ncbi:hypothetical protein, variant [Cladophialophora immunda]|uniref:Uncharacterized protein n=1 Tax=Cladophialophora immunda TaxID=569365 RepID=A0A0D2B7R6_9EURO|nr:hypothetical protein, variant [Cladophialophora immunda]KIW33637.1 hypothetical protein, variant [Cladophialophora immunda]